jgi:CRP-like cAMP-binding protein
MAAWTAGVAAGMEAAAMAADMNLDLLRSSQLFEGFGDDAFLKICASARRRAQDFRKKDVLVRQGEVVSEIGVLVRGSLLSEKYHMNGRVQIVRAFSPCSVVNLDAACSSFRSAPAAITANRDGCVIWLSFDDLTQRGGMPADVRKALFGRMAAILADDNIRLMYKSDILAMRTVRDRVMAYLSIVSEKRGSLTVNIDMNQEEFAQYLCLDRSSLSLELNKMRKEGLLDFKKKTYTLAFRERGVGESANLRAMP